MKPRIFIDGDAGTTGLQILQRLSGRDDLAVIAIEPERRKDTERRRELINAADLVVLCLPDEAARQAVELIDNDAVRVIDASSAHRTDPDWVYGFAEMEPGQADRIAMARRVTNPGCYPTGAIAMLRPLVTEGLLPPDYPLAIHAVSGYSGGGRQLIERFEQADHPQAIDADYYLYGLTLAHKHLSEITTHALLECAPVFVPSVGRFRQGMIDQIGLHLERLNGAPSADDIRAVLARWYGEAAHVAVAPADAAAPQPGLDPQALNDTNDLMIQVFGSDDGRRCLLAAVYDNLGKGASGAAVQNLNIMLGLDQSLGLAAA